jgi:hypothetical protein
MGAEFGKHYDDFNDVLRHLDKDKRQRHLLLGNGFSRAFDNSIFSYNSLSDYAKHDGNDSISQLFQITKTSNFEEAIHSIDIAVEIIKTIQTTDKNLGRKLDRLSSDAKHSLIDAITKLHPEYVYKLTETEIDSCGRFLQTILGSPYDSSIISTNYDLLLYWVLMRYGDRHPEIHISDGFTYELDNFNYAEEFDKDEHSLVWSPKEKQNIFYLHGALHLFASIEGVIKEKYKESAVNSYLMNRIEKRIHNKQYPIFVTAGNGEEKKQQISRNAYLLNCYTHLRTIKGSLITYGFSFGDSDTHIIDALNMAANQGKKDCLRSVYIGTFSDNDRAHIESICTKFKAKVNTFDVKSVDVWGHNVDIK